MMILHLRKLRLELALDCPLRCVHCSANAAPGHPLAMPFGLASRLIREFASMGGEEVTFTGGEPLVEPVLPSLLAEATGYGLSTVIFTSGIIYANSRQAERIAVPAESLGTLMPVLSRAVFSVYSADPAIHDAITRTAGSLALTHEAIRRTVAAGIVAEIHFVPTRSNYRDLPVLVDKMARLGVRAIRVIRYVPQGRGHRHRDQLRLDATQQRELRNMLHAIIARCGIEIRVGSAFGYLLDDAPPCSAALDELVVSASGRIYPCSGFSGFQGTGAIGTVLNAPLAQVWRDAPYLRAVRAIHTAHAARGGSLSCHMGCPAQKAIASGWLTDTATDPDVALLSSQELPQDASGRRPQERPGDGNRPVVLPMVGG